MYAGISAAFLPSLRAGHTSYGYLEAWYGGVRLTVDDGAGNQTTRLPLEETGQNEVIVDATKIAGGKRSLRITLSGRRTLNATLTPTPGLWKALSPVGTELHAYVVLRHPSGATETLPVGVFQVDTIRRTYGPGGTIAITAPDRWMAIQNARFLTPRASTPGITNRQQIANLITEVLPAGTTVTDIATSTATVPHQTWDQYRDQAIEGLAAAAGLDVYFDRNGNPVIRDAPVLNPAAATWTVDSGDGGVMVTADRERNRQKTYNIIVVNGQSTSSTAPFATQYVWDNDSTSQTYCGPGTGAGPTAPAPSAAGPFRQRPTFYTSPLLANTAQAIAAGRALLAETLGTAAQMTLTSLPNAALDEGDTILVKLPAERRDLPPTLEMHLVDGFTVPLVPSTNDMPITTRSTRPDDLVGT
jgi:hypothetical protein